MKTTKGKLIVTVITLVLVIGGVFGYNAYAEYQESIRSSVVFKNTEELGLSEDLMTLIDTFEADTVAVNRIIDANEKVVDEPTVGRYIIVFEAVSNGHATEFKKEITFIDDEGPVILGASDKEIDYAAELDLIEGVTAEDNVDGMVEVTSTILNNKLVGIQPIEYTAKDSAGNEAKLMINVTVKQPACSANAIWNGEDCVCDEGYTGDGWSACAVEKKTTSSASGTKTTTSSGGTSSKGSGSSSTGSSSNTGSTSSNSNGGWTVEWGLSDNKVPQSAVDQATGKYDTNYSYGGVVGSDGTVISDWGVVK